MNDDLCFTINPAPVGDVNISTAAATEPAAPAEPPQQGQQPKIYGDVPQIPVLEAVEGIRFDFNDGIRILFPHNGKEYHVTFSDIDTGIILYSADTVPGAFITSVKKFFIRFRLIIHDKGNGIFVRVNRLNITAHSFLQIFQLTANLYVLGIHIGTNQEHIHHGSLFLLNLTLCLSAKRHAGEVFGIQNMLGIVIGCLNLFLRSITIFSLHRDRLFQGLGDFYVILFQVSLPPFL